MGEDESDSDETAPHWGDLFKFHGGAAGLLSGAAKLPSCSLDLLSGASSAQWKKNVWQ